MQRSTPTEELLHATELCGGLPESVRCEIARSAHRLHVPAGRFVIDAGQEEAPCYLIIEGSVQLAVPNVAGNEKTIATLTAGKAFGLAESFSGLAYRYYARTQEPTLFVTVAQEVLLELATREQRLLRNVLAALGRQFDALAQDIENSNRFSAHQRVVNLLLTTARMQADGKAVTRLAYKKSLTASRLGLAPETFSRSLAQLVEQGLISVDQRTITIHDVEAMQALLAHAH